MISITQAYQSILATKTTTNNTPPPKNNASKTLWQSTLEFILIYGTTSTRFFSLLQLKASFLTDAYTILYLFNDFQLKINEEDEIYRTWNRDKVSEGVPQRRRRPRRARRRNGRRREREFPRRWGQSSSLLKALCSCDWDFGVLVAAAGVWASVCSKP